MRIESSKNKFTQEILPINAEKRKELEVPKTKLEKLENSEQKYEALAEKAELISEQQIGQVEKLGGSEQEIAEKTQGVTQRIKGFLKENSLKLKAVFAGLVLSAPAQGQQLQTGGRENVRNLKQVEVVAQKNGVQAKDMEEYRKLVGQEKRYNDSLELHEKGEKNILELYKLQDKDWKDYAHSYYTKDGPMKGAPNLNADGTWHLGREKVINDKYEPVTYVNSIKDLSAEELKKQDLTDLRNAEDVLKNGGESELRFEGENFKHSVDKDGYFTTYERPDFKLSEKGIQPEGAKIITFVTQGGLGGITRAPDGSRRFYSVTTDANENYIGKQKVGVLRYKKPTQPIKVAPLEKQKFYQKQKKEKKEGATLDKSKGGENLPDQKTTDKEIPKQEKGRISKFNTAEYYSVTDSITKFIVGPDGKTKKPYVETIYYSKKDNKVAGVERIDPATGQILSQ